MLPAHEIGAIDFFGGRMLRDTEIFFFDEDRYGDKVDLHLMQFTGLKDKNDKEIYEDDFLKDEYNRILLVEWWQYAFTLKAITKTNFVRANYIIQWFLGVPFLPEIIGNIYENPELLKQDNLCACKEVKEQDENTPEKR